MWIKVKDKLPPVGVPVLFALPKIHRTKYRKVTIGTTEHTGHYWWDHMTKDYNGEHLLMWGVEFWQYLPEIDEETP